MIRAMTLRNDEPGDNFAERLEVLRQKEAERLAGAAQDDPPVAPGMRRIYRDDVKGNPPQSSKPAKAVASVGTFSRMVLRADGTLTYRGKTYQVAGARAEISEFASGAMNRKHSATVTVIFADGTQEVWMQTDTGATARMVYRNAVTFCAAVNSMASRSA